MSDPRSKIVRIADSELHYLEEGAGATVVLVHGGFGDYRLWTGLSRSLSKRFRVISYSRRGSYPNKAPSRGHARVGTHSADLASVITQLSNEPVHLVGESYGAYVALYFAIHNQELVRTIALDEPPIVSVLGSGGEDRRDSEALQRVLTAFLEAHARGDADAARSIVDFLEGPPGAYDSLPNEVKEVIRANAAATFADLNGGLGGVVRDEVRSMRRPALLMKSEKGPRVLKRIVDILADDMPDSRLQEIRGASHGTIIESAEYVDSVLRFLTLD